MMTPTFTWLQMRYAIDWLMGVFLLVLSFQIQAQQPTLPPDHCQEIQFKLSKLPAAEFEVATVDWLTEHPGQIAKVNRAGEKDLIISNGLISRTIRLTPNAATVSLKNLVTSEEYIRSVKPEALVVIDGVSYPVGGLKGQKEHGYFLPGWLDNMYSESNAFVLKDFEIKDMTDHIHWRHTRWIPRTQWNREGKEVVFYYEHTRGNLSDVVVEIHYEIFNKIPLMAKWMVVRNNGELEIRINHFTSEIIAHPEKNNFVDVPVQWDAPNLYMKNDYAFGGFTYVESDRSISWETDPEYTSQVNWERKTPVILKSQPKTGPDYRLTSGELFESFHTYLLALDGTDRERNSLSKRKMYRTLAPWVTENPIFMHLTTTNSKKSQNCHRPMFRSRV